MWIICLIGLIVVFKGDKNETIVYLVPSGIKGWCHLVWDDPHAKPLAEQDGQLVARLNNKCTAHTSSSAKGINFTITFYYVDKKEKWIKIHDIEEIKQYPSDPIFIGPFVSQGKDDGPDTSYPKVDQFFLGTPDEITKESPKLGLVNFPPYPKDVLHLKKKN